MLELLQESLKAPNLPATFLLLLVLCFWIVSLLGFIGSGPDFRTDADTNLLKDENVKTGDGSGFYHSVLQFFHIGKAPRAIIVSFFALFFWLGTVLTNHYLGNSSIWLGLLVMLPNCLLGLFLTKIVTQPILKVYKKPNDNEEELISDYSGSVITVTAGTNNKNLGKGEINLKGASILVYIKSLDGELKKGQTALLIEYNKEKGFYIATPYENKKP